MKSDDLGVCLTPADGTIDDPLQAARAIYTWAMLLQQAARLPDAESGRARAVIMANAELLMHRLATGSDRYGDAPPR